MVFFWYCTLSSVAIIGSVIYMLAGLIKIKLLKAQPLIDPQPSLDIIIAVRNEEKDVEKALQSVCNINYQNHRIIVVNDRSTDRTAEILQGFITRYPQLTVTTLTTLPQGWLGKNNALYQGYLSSTAEWMLFTDADVEFHPDAINKAMGYAARNKLDHLCILPEVISRSKILNSVLGTFTVMLLMHLKPWGAINPKSKGSVGIGAFNMVRRNAYEKIGTHARLRLRPDDDLQLGHIIKSAGLRQDVLSGRGQVSLEWYRSVQEFVNGLMKNSFSVTNYNFGRTILDVCAILILVALPLPVILIFGSATERLMGCAALLSQMFLMVKLYPHKWWHAMMIPFAGFLMAYITLKAALLTLKQGGIYWRDTFYSLEMLKGKS